MKHWMWLFLANWMIATTLVASEEARVLVAGSFIQDLAFRINHFPVPGETKIGTFVTGPGGKGSNQAVACARQGTTTCFVGAVGDDSFGKDAVTFWQNEGIKANVTVIPEEGTGTAAIMIDHSGQNSIIVFLGANAYNSSTSIKEAHQEFHPNVVLLQFEINMDAIMDYFDWLPTDNNCFVLLNPAPIPDELDLRVLEKVDILTPNETEFWALLQRKGTQDDLHFEELHNTAPERLHAACRSLQVPFCIVTMGDKGCFVSGPDYYYWVKAPKVDVVSTAGAGDCFSGVLASQLATFNLKEASRLYHSSFKTHLKQSVEHAIIAASLSVTKDGTAPSMPTYQETTRAGDFAAINSH